MSHQETLEMQMICLPAHFHRIHLTLVEQVEEEAVQIVMYLDWMQCNVLDQDRRNQQQKIHLFIQYFHLKSSLKDLQLP